MEWSSEANEVLVESQVEALDRKRNAFRVTFYVGGAWSFALDFCTEFWSKRRWVYCIAGFGFGSSDVSGMNGANLVTKFIRSFVE